MLDSSAHRSLLAATMGNRFIDRKNSRLYKSTSSDSFEMVMIFGDEIAVDITTNLMTEELIVTLTE